MLTEAELDLSSEKMYFGSYLNESGISRWPTLLFEAIKFGNDASLAADLSTLHCMKAFAERKKPTGGTTTVKVPHTAPEMLSEGEYDRYYIRALCLHAIENSIPSLVIYRAKSVSNPRPESEQKIGSYIDPKILLTDLRKNIGVDTALGLPPGPNSGLSVKIPT